MNYFMKKINYILKEYFPGKTYNEFDIIGFIGKIIEENNKENFAIWGAGEHTEVLYKYYSVELKNCKFILDNNKELYGKNFLGIKILSPSEILEHNIDTIFISSYNGRKDIQNNIKKLNLKCKVIDFYDLFYHEFNVKLNQPFYIVEDIYNKLYKLKNKIKKSRNRKVKKELLKEIIFEYIFIADFVNSKRFINIYIDNNFIDKKVMQKLLRDLDNLIIDLHKKITKRTHNDMFLFFLDALRAKDIYNKRSSMKFLNNLLEKSLYFTNAYSTSITTYESVPSMFTGKLPFYNELYKRKVVCQEEVPFIQKAIEEGYDIKIYTPDFWSIIKGKDIKHGIYSPIFSKNIWNVLCDLAENENKNTIYLLYFLQETHPPHLCGYHTKQPIQHSTPFTCNDIINQSQEDFNFQYKECLKYIDNQLEFYFKVMGANNTKIIFSDHGQIIENSMGELRDISTLAGWHDERYHVPLILNGDRINISSRDDIFSMVKFNDLLIHIMENKEYINNQNYIEVNFSKITNNTIKDKYKKVGYEDYLYGFKVLRDKKYKLVITGRGEYKAYILPEQFKECNNENKNEIISNFLKLTDISVPKL